jgi:hypothetical protein
LVRDISPDEMSHLPGAPPLDPGQTISGLLLASRGEIWVNAEEASGQAAAGSRSATNWATGASTAPARNRSSAAPPPSVQLKYDLASHPS